MTIDEFMALDSHARNCVVAEKVLGWEVDRHANMGRRIETPKPGEWGCGCISHNVSGPIPTFTTSIADAWEVIGKLNKTHDFSICTINGHKGYEAELHRDNNYFYGEAESEALAICIAALRAVGAISD